MSKKKSIEQILNEITVFMIYDQLKTLALDCFVWEGLPDVVKQIYIETALFNHGQAAFFVDKRGGGFMCLPCAFSGDFNVYSEPLAYRAFGKGYAELYDIDNCVNIRNNSTRTNMHEPLLMFANDIADTKRAAGVNVKVSKTPFIIKCTDKNLFSVKNMLKQVDENAFAILADKQFNTDDFEILQTTNNGQNLFIADKLVDYKNTILNEALTFIGINNVPQDKKERLITDEANSNNDFIFDNIDARLQWRQNACDEINKKYGLNVSVRLKHKPQENTQIDPDSDEAIEREMEVSL